MQRLNNSWQAPVLFFFFFTICDLPIFRRDIRVILDLTDSTRREQQSRAQTRTTTMFAQHVTAPKEHPNRRAEDDPPMRQGTLFIYDPPMETSSVETRTMPFM